MNKRDFKDKVVLITGASRGIGAACAESFAKSGARVAINYWARADKPWPNAAERTLETLKNLGADAGLYNYDVRDSGHTSEMLERVEHELGEVDVLVHNAFISFTPRNILDYPWEEVQAKVDADLRSMFFLVKGVLPRMLEKKAGVIIAVSSGMSRQPAEGFLPYALSKSAVNSFIRSINVEHARNGIRANVVAPGFTLTDPNKDVPPENRSAIERMTPMRRVADPKDIADGIVMMASDRARFISGAYLPIDGGLTML